MSVGSVHEQVPTFSFAVLRGIRFLRGVEARIELRGLRGALRERHDRDSEQDREAGEGDELRAAARDEGHGTEHRGEAVNKEHGLRMAEAHVEEPVMEVTAVRCEWRLALHQPAR